MGEVANAGVLITGFLERHWSRDCDRTGGGGVTVFAWHKRLRQQPQAAAFTKLDIGGAREVRRRRTRTYEGSSARFSCRRRRDDRVTRVGVPCACKGERLHITEGTIPFAFDGGSACRPRRGGPSKSCHRRVGCFTPAAPPAHSAIGELPQS